MTKPRSRMKRLARLFLFCIALFVMLRWFEHSQIYHPDRSLRASGAELGRPFQDLRFKASDGVELNGWFFPANTNSPRARLAILVCHGNAGNIGDRLELCRALLETGASVFVFDYRGYGRSRGRPGEEGTYRDAQAACRCLGQKGFAGTNIVVFGESLGGAIATELALREPLGGLILQSAFTSIPDIGAEFFPWLPVRLLASIRYDTLSKLPRLNIPVLVMHSRDDEIIPFHHGERNFAAAHEPKLLWELTGEHNNALDDPRRFVAGIARWLDMTAAGTTNPPRATATPPAPPQP